MTFYCLHEGLYKGVAKRIEQLESACNALDIQFLSLDSLTTDYSSLPQLGKSDFLYNVARGSQTLELLLLNEDVTTFYINAPKFAIINDSINFSINHDKYNLPAPKTIYHLTDDKHMLRTYVHHLGGFPIVLKARGGTLGIGAILVRDYETLYSLTEYLYSTKSQFILRQYIPPKDVARLIVIGDKVVASLEKMIPTDDFRTRTSEVTPQPKQYSDEIQDLAVCAAQLANFESAGVDILIGKDGNPYLLEVNMPHDFAAPAEITSINIARLMIEYLQKRQENLSREPLKETINVGYKDV